MGRGTQRSQHYKKLYRVCQYLNGTKTLGITLSPSSLQLYAWIDASYNVHTDAKGHSGVIVSLGREGGLITVKSKKQKLTTKSSTESELVGMYTGIPPIEYARAYMEERGYNQMATTIAQDNQSTIRLAEKGSGNHNRTKHINLRYFYITELIDNGKVQLQYQPTKNMLSDLLTKPLNGKASIQLRNRLLNETHKS